MTPNLFRLTGPTLKAGFCPQSWQELSNTIIGGTQVTYLIQTGTMFFNFGSSTPAAENRIYPWINTSDGLVYVFLGGLWTSPRPKRELDTYHRSPWFCPAGTTESSVWSLDGGDGTDPSIGGNVSDYTGALWQVDHSMDGRMFIGAGAVPNSSPAQSVALGQTGGEGDHTLLITEIPRHGHGIPDGTLGAVLVCGAAGAAWQSNSNPDHGTDTFVWEGGDPANSNATKPHNTLPPYLAGWWLQPTARKYYTLPA